MYKNLRYASHSFPTLGAHFLVAYRTSDEKLIFLEARNCETGTVVWAAFTSIESNVPNEVAFLSMTYIFLTEIFGINSWKRSDVVGYREWTDFDEFMVKPSYPELDGVSFFRWPNTCHKNGKDKRATILFLCVYIGITYWKSNRQTVSGSRTLDSCLALRGNHLLLAPYDASFVTVRNLDIFNIMLPLYEYHQNNSHFGMFSVGHSKTRFRQYAFSLIYILFEMVFMNYIFIHSDRLKHIANPSPMLWTLGYWIMHCLHGKKLFSAYSELDDQGWILGPHGELLFWVSEGLWHCMMFQAFRKTWLREIRVAWLEMDGM